ncbi:MAG: GGDEF domain-containing protein [Gammaproteobacteria bacterium]
MAYLMRLHRLKIGALLLLANAALILYLWAGEPKPATSIAWTDVIGEGGTAVLALAWIFLVLKSRPAGRVTTLLVSGLGCLFFSWWVDTLDEFIALPDAVNWDHWLESVPMPVGMLLLTLGIYHWHHEQLVISEQMAKREKLFREHRLFDKVTPLGGADYLRQQLSLALQLARQEQQPLSLVMLDLNHFARINDQYGFTEGDRVLQALTQLLLLNLRRHDLLFRLAGDRFVALLPNTGEAQARGLAQALAEAVNHFAYHSQQQGERIPLQAVAAVVMATGDSPESLLQRLHLALAHAKQPPHVRCA